MQISCSTTILSLFNMVNNEQLNFFCEPFIHFYVMFPLWIFLCSFNFQLLVNIRLCARRTSWLLSKGNTSQWDFWIDNSCNRMRKFGGKKNIKLKVRRFHSPINYPRAIYAKLRATREHENDSCTSWFIIAPRRIPYSRLLLLLNAKKRFQVIFSEYENNDQRRIYSNEAIASEQMQEVAQ